MSSPRTRRGQVSSADAVLATIIFSVMLVFLVAFWSVTVDNLENITTKNRLENDAVMISDILVKTPGIPEDWEKDASSLEMPGFAVSGSDQNVLGREKLANFTALGYNRSRELLGLDESVEFYFILENLDNNRLYEAGNPDIAGKGTGIAVVRFAVLRDGGTLEPVRMRLTVYEG